MMMTYVARTICIAISFALLPQREMTAVGVQQPAIIAGRVVTGVGDARPVRRARVFLSRVDGPGGATEITDDEGRFSFTDLPAGRYMLGADKAGFVRMNYGETRPGRPGSAIVITEGQQLPNLTLHLLPGGVITGTVFDQAGNGASDVEVYFSRSQLRSGERTLDEINSVRTDDRGVYRIYGLIPGEYVIAAKPSFRFGSGAARETTAADFERVTSARQKPGAMTGRPPRAVGYATVYYPGTPEQASAVPIVITAGAERSAVDIVLQTIPLSSVEGRITWPNNRPKSVQAAVMMIPLTQSPWLHGMEFDTAVGNDLTFAFRHVIPGRYAIVAQSLSERGREGADLDVPPALSAVHEIDVQGDDVDGIVLALQPGASLSGRIVRGDGNAAPEIAPDRLSLQLRPAATSVTARRPADVTLTADGNFAITGITPGSYRLVLRSRPADLAIASAAVVNNVNVLDDPVEFRSGDAFTGVVVTLTARPTELSGRMQDRADRPAPEHHIVVFSTDRQRWFRDSRHIQAVRPATDGRYLVRGLPPGDYFLAALTDIEDGEWFDPEFLNALVPAAIRISLADGEKKIQDIRIGG